MRRSLLPTVWAIALLLTLATLLAADPAAASYQLVDLGPNTSAAAVNDRGQVAMNTVPRHDGDPPSKGELWEAGRTTVLQGTDPSIGSGAMDLAPNGRVVGSVYGTQGPVAAFWQGSGTPQLIPLTAETSAAVAVNAAGDAVGYYTYDSAPFTGPKGRAFVAPVGGGGVEAGTADTPTQASDRTGRNWSSRAVGIDDAGNILGVIQHGSGPETGTYLWPSAGAPGRRLPLSDVVAIAHDGEILGLSQYPVGTPSAARWQLLRGDGAVIPLCPANDCAAYDVQNGMVVGSKDFGGVRHPALWRDGQWTDLAPLFPAGWEAAQVGAISPNGNIVGTVQLGADRVSHAFLLTSAKLLSVTLRPGVVVDDTFGLRVTTSNVGGAGDPSLSALDFGAGVFQNPVIPQLGARVVPSLLLGPVPGYPPALAPGQTTTHDLAYEVTGAGTAQLRIHVTGKRSDGTTEDAESAVLVQVTRRDPTRQELDGLVAGGLTSIFDSASAAHSRLVGRFLGSLRAQFARTRAGARALSSSLFDRAMASSLALKPDALAWMPDHDRTTGHGADRRPGRREIALAFLRGTGDGISVVAHKAGDHIAAPWQAIANFIVEPADGARVQLGLEEATRAASGAVHATAGYLGTAADFYAHPAQWQAAWDDLPRMGAQATEELNRLQQIPADAATALFKVYERDPVDGAYKIGKAIGQIDGEVVTAVAQGGVGLRANAAVKELDAARRAAGVRSEVSDVAATTTAMEEVAHTATPLTETKALGNLSPRQVTAFQQLVRRGEAKFGIKLELQAKPINADAAAVRDALGKLEAIPTKNLTRDDILLGAPSRWLAQAVYYKPRLPSDFEELGADVQARLRQRAADKLEEWEQFHGLRADPTGKTQKVLKALEPGGAELKLGRADKLSLELHQTVDAETDAILLEYKKIKINGRNVFTGDPKSIISDVDMGALINADTLKHLPAGIRGQAELWLMNEFRKLAEAGVFPFGYHGWTHSGFDLTAKDYRYLLKYQLMYMSPDDAAKVAAKYAKIYGTTPDEFLAGFTPGKFLVRITADDASLGLTTP